MAKSTNQTERAGIHAVGAIFTALGWAFREQPTSDFGIDAHAEKLNDDGLGGGKLIALQIKSGSSYFKKRGEDYVFYGEDRHREYWTNHSLPVFIVVHDPETQLTLWQKVEQHLIEEGKDGRWSITIPVKQQLDEANEQYITRGIASDLGSIRRHRLTLDLPIIRQFAEHEMAYLHVEDWVNKSLNFRHTVVVFGDDPDGEPELDLETWLPAYTIDRFMAVHFPWLNWKEHEYIGAEHGSYEVACWVLEVELSDVGKAALILDDFYASELPPDERQELDVDPEMLAFLAENDVDDPDDLET